MDAFERWFAVLRERGEVPDFRVMRFDSPRGAPVREWSFAHERYDGARMMEAIASDLGLPAPQLPRVREERPPSFFARVGALWRELHDAPRPIVPWRHFDSSARPHLAGPYAFALFDRDEVARMTQAAAARGARLNSLLLWSLDAAVHDALANPQPFHRWAVPVNLRGALGRKETLANGAAFVGVDIPEGASPEVVKQGIRAQLERNAHWGAWDAFRLLGWLGARRMRRYADKYLARPGHSWLGTFTNVGPYESMNAGWLCLVPPVTRSHPVGAGAMQVGGRLSLGIQFHAALGGVDPAAIMGRWRGLLAASGVGTEKAPMERQQAS